MKLGAKKTRQSELLDALGTEALLSEDMSVPPTPAISGTPDQLVQKDERGSVPAIVAERSDLNHDIFVIESLTFHIYSVHVVVREIINCELVHEGGLNHLELKGDMNLKISDPSLARVKLTLAPTSQNYGPELQFKQHPNVSKFAANKERVVALKDSARGFPVGQPLAVLKWRYSGKDETYVPLSSAHIYSLLAEARH